MIFWLYDTPTPTVLTATPRSRARCASPRKPGTSRTPAVASPSLSTIIRCTVPALEMNWASASSIPQEMQVSPPSVIPRIASRILDRLADEISVAGTITAGLVSKATTLTVSPSAR